MGVAITNLRGFLCYERVVMKAKTERDNFVVFFLLYGLW